ncbi:TIGR01777 family oxidoreductase [Croceivirga thetidis]|uniref:TIGR01777 family protein n=1 Tax=Croceivirga thetidis TaxID=2721623 RepID=A0ABX1GSR1_9FLAO|nr:TIGR01777 family oxidoreductase [Croceivirga thetidis]NKI32990.1 TIGR01777 family protein [Croceivirga thetidis]
MKVLITGATGLVGKQLTKDLLEKGYSVNYLTTNKSKIENKSNFQGFFWDPSVGEIDSNCFEDVSVIINLAGASIAKRWTSEYKKLVLNSRVDSLNTLNEGLEKSGNKGIISFISASAIGIYPNSNTTFYDEDYTKIDDSFLGEVVQAWENAADQFLNQGFSVAKVRIGLVLSNDGGALPQIAQPIQNYTGAALGSGEQWQSWIHIKDLSQIFIHIFENGLNGIFNGVAPNPVTNNKLTKAIAEILKRPLVLPNVPRFVLKMIFGEMAYVLLASQRVSSKKIENEGFVFTFTNITNALESFYIEDFDKEVSNAYTENNFI